MPKLWAVKILRRAARAARGGDLTTREIEALRLLARGLTAPQVGVRPGIAPRTAANLVQNLHARLGVTTRAAAVLFAVETGLHATD